MKGLLANIEKMLLGLKGKTPSLTDGARPGSKLHNTYSINGQPNFARKPSPSNLDLDGNTPGKYLDNPPT